MPRTIEGEPLTSLPGLSFNSFYRHRLRSFSCANTELYCVISRAVDVTMNVTVVRFDQVEKAEHVFKYIKEEPHVKIEEVDEANVEITVNDGDVEVKEEIIDTHLIPVNQTEQPGKEAVLRFYDDVRETTEESSTTDKEMLEADEEDDSLFDNDQKETVERPPDPSIKECFYRVIPAKYRRGMQLRPRPHQIKKTKIKDRAKNPYKTTAEMSASAYIPSAADDVSDEITVTKIRVKRKRSHKTKIKRSAGSDVPDEMKDKTKRTYNTKARRSAGADVPDENSNINSTENFNFTSTGRFVNAPKRYPN